MILTVEGHADGSYTLLLSPPLFRFIEKLPLDFRNILTSSDGNEALLARLFPPAYGKADLDREYRELLGMDLLQRKMDCMEIFEACLAAMEEKDSLCRVPIAKNEFNACLAFINDFRIILGIELDIKDDDWQQPSEQHADEIGQQKYGLLSVLTILQQSLLEATGLVDFEIDGEANDEN